MSNRTFIAFLRAINVGRRRVRMDRLREVFQEMGFAAVSTFIASGNVIFTTSRDDAAALEAEIEEHLHGSLGYPVATCLRTPAELAEITRVSRSGGEVQTLLVGFLRNDPGRHARERLVEMLTPTDEFRLHRREVYWSCTTRMSDSTITGAMLEKALESPLTVRNITTLAKLAAKYPPVDQHSS
ncbi:DUF1697 domain-containing protein [soil metagenome]